MAGKANSKKARNEVENALETPFPCKTSVNKCLIRIIGFSRDACKSNPQINDAVRKSYPIKEFYIAENRNWVDESSFFTEKAPLSLKRKARIRVISNAKRFASPTRTNIMKAIILKCMQKAPFMSFPNFSRDFGEQTDRYFVFQLERASEQQGFPTQTFAGLWWALNW